MEEVELDNFDETIEDEEDEEDETTFGPDISENIDWLDDRERYLVDIDYGNIYNSYFSNKVYQAKQTVAFFDEVLGMEKEVNSPKFIKHLFDKEGLEVKKIISYNRLVMDYEFSVKSKPHINENGITIKSYETYKTEDGQLNDVDKFRCIDNVRYHYDRLRRMELNRKLKRGGVIGAIGLSVGSIITGLALGLKRSGHDIVNDSETKAKKLTPADKKGASVPWTDLEEATGRSIVKIGDHLYLIIGGSIFLLLVNKT